MEGVENLWKKEKIYMQPQIGNDEYITVITPDMKYFILRKGYRVKKKRGKNIRKCF